MDQRQVRRRPARYIAWADVGGGALPVRCYVENVSDSGAKISIYRSAIPDEFTLYFSRKGDAKVRCQVRWRRGVACGVAFTTSQPEVRTPGQAMQELMTRPETAAA